MILIALFAAITAICAQITIPIGPVPFTLQTLAIALTAVILGRYGGFAILLYLIIGAIGVPVFSGFKAGFPVLIGPTGGFLIGFTLAAFIMGFIIDRMNPSFIKALIINILGLAFVYVIGVTQLKFLMDLTWAKAMSLGIIPFILPDLLKIGIACYLGVLIRRRLHVAGLYPSTKQKAA
jgi:biotin transport system substrate-specific component